VAPRPTGTPAPRPTRPSPPPERTTRANNPLLGLLDILGRRVDPDLLGDRAEAFYQRLTADPAAAYAMTTGPARRGGEQAFRQRYADIAHVQLTKIVIDVRASTVHSFVRLTLRDGSTRTERRVITFSSGSDPRISSEHPH